ncbi:MAG TPA: hypothetical protein VFW83_09980, partial [Bryobacteraceae bacterium]|nr:hypothetical protein [Bryobacteraceae bacterium]
MRLLAVSFLMAGIALFAQPQRQLGISPTGFGRMINPSGIPPAQGGAGFGRLIYPGTPAGPPAVRRNSVLRARQFRPPAIAHRHRGENPARTVIVPYPVFYGGDFYGYDAPPPEEPGYDNGYGNSGYDQGYAPQQQSPVVIINQNFRPDTINPSVRDYSNAPLPPAQPNPDESNQLNPNQPNPNQSSSPQPQSSIDSGSPVVFLIAMKDHTIYPAVAYWVEGNTLNYITLQGVHNSAT